MNVSTDKTNLIDAAKRSGYNTYFNEYLGVPIEWEAYPLSPIPHSNKSEWLKRLLVCSGCLEIPVGNFVYEQASSDIEVAFYSEALLHNAQDELVHDRQITLMQDALLNTQAYSDERSEVLKTLDSITAGIEPIVLSGLIELCLFFPMLAMLRRYGNEEFLQASTYISKDEARHVKLNMLISEDLLTRDKVETFREFSGFFMNLILEGFYDAEKWRGVSDDMLDKRSSDKLAFTSTPLYPAFFEITNY